MLLNLKVQIHLEVKSNLEALCQKLLHKRANLGQIITMKNSL
jgi:hypothetical protein